MYCYIVMSVLCIVCLYQKINKKAGYIYWFLCFPLKDGVILGADTRATEGMIVADKNCSKIHYISSNIL